MSNVRNLQDVTQLAGLPAAGGVRGQDKDVIRGRSLPLRCGHRPRRNCIGDGRYHHPILIEPGTENGGRSLRDANRRILGEHAYVYPDGIWMKPSWGGELKNGAVLIPIGVDAQGSREVVRLAERAK